MLVVAAGAIGSHAQRREGALHDAQSRTMDPMSPAAMARITQGLTFPASGAVNHGNSFIWTYNL